MINNEIELIGIIEAGQTKVFATTYEGLPDKPSINNVVLSGNKTLKDIGVEKLVDEKISKIVNSAPETLDTLGEIAEEIAKNQSVVDALNESISKKANESDLSKIAKTGNYEDLNNKPNIPTKTSDVQNDGDGSSKFATEQYVNQNGGKIDEIQVNGVPQQIVDKKVNLNIDFTEQDPTVPNYVKNIAESDIENWNNKVDATTENLVNYYLKKDTYSKEEVNQLISDINGLKKEIVTTLPTENIDTNTIYLVAKESGDGNDYYNEYLYINGNFEFIGSTQIDLTDYVKNTDYATHTKGGVVRINGSFGITEYYDGIIGVTTPTEEEINDKVKYKPLTPFFIDKVIQVGLTTNSLEWTDEQKQLARALIGAVGQTDYATDSKAGIVRASSNSGYGIGITTENILKTVPANENQIKAKTSNYMPIVPATLDKAIKIGLTTNTETFTDEEKANARNLIDAVGNNDYATNDKAGIVKISDTGGVKIGSGGEIYLDQAVESDFIYKANGTRVLRPKDIDNIVKAGITTNTISLTSEEKTKAKQWLGITESGNSEQSTVLTGNVNLYDLKQGYYTVTQGSTVYFTADVSRNVYNDCTFIVTREKFEDVGYNWYSIYGAFRITDTYIARIAIFNYHNICLDNYTMSSVNNEFYRASQVDNLLSYKLSPSNIVAGDNINIVKEGSNLIINSTASGGGSTGEGQQIYDLVIKTQEEFEAFYTSLDNGTCTAKSVLLVGDGELTPFMRSDGKGLKLPMSLFSLHGINGALILISDFQYSETNKACIWYEEPVWDVANLYSIKGIMLMANSGSITFGFSNCFNLDRCLVLCTGGNANACYHNCHFISNCFALSEGETAYAFHGCSCISNCMCNLYATNTNVNFKECSYISNCQTNGGDKYENCSYVSATLEDVSGGSGGGLTTEQVQEMINASINSAIEGSY